MSTKVVVSVYMDLEKPNDEIAALLATLLGNTNVTVSNEPVTEQEETKPKKTRKRREYTDEEKAAFRARMIAGKKAKEEAENTAVDKAAEVDQEKSDAMVEAEPVEPAKSSGSKSKKGSPEPAPKKSIPPLPRSGRKVEAKPAAA